MVLGSVIPLHHGKEGVRGERKCFSAELKIACVTECSKTGTLLYMDVYAR